MAGLQLLLQGVEPVLRVLPAGQKLRVTLLNDADPQQYEKLRNAWEHNWSTVGHESPPPTLTVTAELSYQWTQENLQTPSPVFDLMLVVQVQGEAAYSDGLAALLLYPDSLVGPWGLPVQGRLLRPIPLAINALDSELAMFLQTQPGARQATGLLADAAHWQHLIGSALAIGLRWRWSNSGFRSPCMVYRARSVNGCGDNRGGDGSASRALVADAGRGKIAMLD